MEVKQGDKLVFKADVEAGLDMGAYDASIEKGLVNEEFVYVTFVDSDGDVHISNKLLEGVKDGDDWNVVIDNGYDLSKMVVVPRHALENLFVKKEDVLKLQFGGVSEGDVVRCLQDVENIFGEDFYIKGELYTVGIDYFGDFGVISDKGFTNRAGMLGCSFMREGLIENREAVENFPKFFEVVSRGA